MLEPTKPIRNILQKVLDFNENQAFFLLFEQSIVMDYVLDLNTNEQLFKEGVDSTGQKIGIYSGVTFDSKIRKFGRFPEHITLYDTGEFYESFKINNTKNGYIDIIANPNKNGENLFQKYGEEIVGLTDESKTKLQEFSIAILQNIVAEQMFGL